MSNDFAQPARSTDPGPSRLWYLAAVAILVAGMAGMGAFLVSRLTDMDQDLVQVVVPGETELALEAGSYTIFHESRSTVEGRIYDVDGIAGLGVALASADGEPVAISPASTNSSYAFAGRSGRAAFEFGIVDPGIYRLSAAYREGAAGPQTVLALGKGFVGGLVQTLLGAFAIAFTGIGLALFVGGRVFLRRRAARRASEGRTG